MTSGGSTLVSSGRSDRMTSGWLDCSLAGQLGLMACILEDERYAKDP